MDPRLLLGIDAGAPRAEVRAAHRRLRRAVDPANGGSAGLVALVDAAADVVTTGRGADRLSLDPHAVLGIGATPSPIELRSAYRRVALTTHPDRGGTDELFRVVLTAFEVLAGTAPRRSRRVRAPGPPAPPPPPPPRGPYRAPDPASRQVVSRWRAWRDLAQHALPLLAAALVVIGANEIHRNVAVVTVMVLVVWFGSILRPSVDGLLRAVVVLRGARVRVAPAVEPERFLEERCLDTPVGRQREDILYEAYVRWCRGRGDPVPSWVFVERLRSLGLLFVKASAWDAGLWVGVTLRR